MKKFILILSILSFSLYGFSQTVIRSYDNVEGNPVAYVSDHNNNLYILSSVANGYIDKVSPDGVVTSKWATVGVYCNDLTIDAEGNLYTLNFANTNTSIFKITPDGSSTLFANLGYVKAPHKIIVGPQGDLFVNEYSVNQDSRIIKIAPDGTVDLNFATVSACCTGMVCDKAGNVYTANESSNSVSKVSTDGSSVHTWAVVTGTPYNITIDDSGNLYTANISGGTISKITPDGVVIQNFGGALVGSNPRYILTDRLGNVYVANNGDNSISKITPDGRMNNHYAQITGLLSGLYSFGIDSAGNLYTGSSLDKEVIKIEPVVMRPAAGILYVDLGAPAGGNGGSWATAIGSLQDALIAADTLNQRGADSVHQIWVAHGSYALQPGYSFSMLPKVKIYGSFAGTETSLNQRSLGAADTSILLGNQASVIRNDLNGLDSSAVLDGFKITGGTALAGTSNSKYGGGIYNRGVSPVFRHLVITGNSAADIGGGMLNDNGASPLIQDIIFSNNSAAIRGGAGLANFSGSNARLFNVLFYQNNTSAGNGAAIYNSGSVTTLTNSTLSDNVTTGTGGAVYSTGAGAEIKAFNSIFWNNQSTAGTGNEFGNSGSLAIELSNCIYRSGASNVTGALNILSASLEQNPGFVDPATGNYQLSSGSPAIDAGLNAYVPGTLTEDLAGANRVENNVVDMGAYEYQPSVLPVHLEIIKGAAKNQIATIEWISGVENNLSHYELQRSENGIDFNLVGSIAAKGSGSGYIYTTDQHSAIAYYRLKSIDLDTRFYISQVIRVVDNSLAGTTTENAKSADILLYPNPAGNFIKLQTSQAGQLRIYGVNGLEVFSQQLPAGLNQVNIARLNSGIYFVRLNGLKGRFVKL